MENKIVTVLRFVFAFVLYFGVAQAVGAKPNAQTETEYPRRPIRMIAVVTAGGGADIYARMLARKIGETLAQQVVVDNRGGANGVIGTELAVKAAPDGYTLLFVTSAHAINAADRRRLPYDTLVDLAPISLFTEFGIFLVAYPGFPPKSVPELLALARARPGQINYGATAPGSALHLAAEMMNLYAKVNLVRVSYRGAAEALSATLGGEVPLSFHGPTIMPHVKAGRLRVLAVTSSNRSSAWSEVPTMQEGGVPNYHFTTWHGLLAPRHIPAPVVARLGEAMAQLARDPLILKPLMADGAVVHGSSPDQFQKFIVREIKKYTDVVQALGGLPRE